MAAIDDLNQRAAALVADANVAISQMAEIHEKILALEVERFEIARDSELVWPEPHEVMQRIRYLTHRCSTDAAFRATREAVRA